MGIRFKVRKMTEKRWKKEEKKRNKLFGKDGYRRFSSLNELNEFSSQLNDKRFMSEVSFEKYMSGRFKSFDIIFWKNYPILNTFFADFFDPVKNIAVEIDGASHDATGPKDVIRDKMFLFSGVRVFRIKFPGFEGIEDLKKFIVDNYSPKSKPIRTLPSRPKKPKIYAKVRKIQKALDDQLLWGIGKGKSPLIK